MRQSFTHRTLTGILVVGFFLSSIFSSPLATQLVNSFMNAGLNSSPKQDISLFDEEGQVEGRFELDADDHSFGKSPIDIPNIDLSLFGPDFLLLSATHSCVKASSGGLPRFLAFHALLI